MTINFVPWTNEIPFYKEDAKSLIISTGSKNPGNSIVLRPAWKTILYVFQLIRQKVAERKFSLTWRSNRIKSLLPLEVKIREIALRSQTEKTCIETAVPRKELLTFETSSNMFQSLQDWSSNWLPFRTNPNALAEGLKSSFICFLSLPNATFQVIV